jgi:hypothetical protein
VEGTYSAHLPGGVPAKLALETITRKVAITPGVTVQDRTEDKNVRTIAPVGAHRQHAVHTVFERRAS